MSRTYRMSVFMTQDAVRAGTKTVTRRRTDTWKNLHVGDELVLIEKGQGLKAGEKQVEIRRAVVIDVRVELLHLVDDDEVVAEGCGGMEPGDFQVWWAESHAYRWTTQSEFMAIECRRIEWRYLDPGPGLASHGRAHRPDPVPKRVRPNGQPPWRQDVS